MVKVIGSVRGSIVGSIVMVDVAQGSAIVSSKTVDSEVQPAVAVT